MSKNFFGPKQEHLNTRTFRSVYKNPRKMSGHEYKEWQMDGSTLRRMMLDKHTDPDLTEQTVQAYIKAESEFRRTDELYSEIATYIQMYRESHGDKNPARLIIEKRFKVDKHTANRILRTDGQLPVYGHMVYKWMGGEIRGLKPLCTSIPTSSVRAIITALVETMPCPVQEIRQELVHGTNVMQAYSEASQTLLKFALYFCEPYAERKISAEENVMAGRVYGRQLYRTTDMGQSGRMFSDADRTDIINRTMLLSFCPLICRSVPITDKGNGYVVIRSVTTKRTAGKKMFTKHRVSAAMKRVQEATKNFRQGKITEQEYTKFLSSVKLPKKREAGKFGMIERTPKNGFWIEFTCTETGQVFKTFTQSAAKAEYLCSLTGIVAEAESCVVYSHTEGTFGVANIMQPVELEARTVFPFREDGVFFRTLKHVTRNLFRYLFRRADHDDVILAEHKYTKLSRKSFRAPFLLELLSSEHLFTAEERDIVATELTLPEHLPYHKEQREKRAQMFRDLVSTRTGHECTVTRKQYELLRERLYSKLQTAESDPSVRRFSGLQFNAIDDKPTKDLVTRTLHVVPRMPARTFTEILHDSFSHGVSRSTLVVGNSPITGPMDTERPTGFIPSGQWACVPDGSEWATLTFTPEGMVPQWYLERTGVYERQLIEASRYFSGGTGI